MRDSQRPLQLDFSLLGKAQHYYTEHGFTDIAVPWVVDLEYSAATAPAGVAFYHTIGGVLVSSAEHSFIQMQAQGWDEKGAYQATSPCFRDEYHDEIHSPYFMKTELFDNENVTVERMHEIRDTALAFFNTLTTAKVEDIGDGTYDIVGEKSGVELGSYGIREYKGFRWIYGTGLALPRLNQVQAFELL